MPRPTETCCATLQTMSTPPDESVAALIDRGIVTPEQAQEMRLSLPDAPLIEWVEHLRAYSIGHTVIFHCPWCGGVLPQPQMPPPGPAGSVFLNADGTVHSDDGKPVDPAVADWLRTLVQPPKGTE